MQWVKGWAKKRAAYRTAGDGDKVRRWSKIRMRDLRAYRKRNWALPKGHELDHVNGLTGKKKLRVIPKSLNRSLGQKKTTAIRKKKPNYWLKK
jgi:hypothetical protein